MRQYIPRKLYELMGYPSTPELTALGLYALFVILATTLSALIYHPIVPLMVATAGVYFLTNYILCRSKINSLCRSINKISEDHSHFARVKWHDLSFFSGPRYLRKIDELERWLIALLGVRVILDHSKILARKRGQTLIIDDYGYSDAKRWSKEKIYFIRRVLMNEIAIYACETEYDIMSSKNYIKAITEVDISFMDDWDSRIDDVLSVLDEPYDEEYQDDMSGHEYEHYVASLIRRFGWNANVTPGSGDHGADIIAENDGERIAIQCKFFSGSVGNKSVQEAFSAKGFYDCERACVVSNSNFTPAAKKAASKLGIALLHHDDLESYLAD